MQSTFQPGRAGIRYPPPVLRAGVPFPASHLAEIQLVARRQLQPYSRSLEPKDFLSLITWSGSTGFGKLVSIAQSPFVDSSKMRYGRQIADGPLGGLA
jgi:hypothetical protein